MLVMLEAPAAPAPCKALLIQMLPAKQEDNTRSQSDIGPLDVFRGHTVRFCQMSNVLSSAGDMHGHAAGTGADL